MPETPAADMRDLTEDERHAIRSLQRLAAHWPPTLMLFSWSGSLVVVPSDGSFADAADPESLVIDTIAGIPNDGGDP